VPDASLAANGRLRCSVRYVQLSNEEAIPLLGCRFLNLIHAKLVLAATPRARPGPLSSPASTAECKPEHEDHSGKITPTAADAHRSWKLSTA
jgi:hypothetical protein